MTVAFVAVLLANNALAQQAAQPRQPVSQEQAVYLIRSSLLRLNDADRAGNYSVLRDLASPMFQAAHTDADVAASFSNLRRSHIDLSEVGVLTPQLTAPPALDELGLLELSGFFPTRPVQIWFNLKFQDVSGEWRLAMISVATHEAPVTTKPSSVGGRRR